MRDPWDVDAWPHERRGVRVLPVLHGVLEFTRAVRAHLDGWRPDRVVVEIPAPVGEAWIRAVGELPRPRVVRVEEQDGPRRGEVSWLLVEPADPLAEATRRALERGLPVECADAWSPGYPARREAWPDPAGLPVVGYARWVEEVLPLVEAREGGREDRLRERTLAATARAAADRGERVLLVVGLAHLPGVLAALDDPPVTPLLRRARLGVAVLPLHPESLVETWREPPFVAAAWERARGGDLPCRYAPPENPREAIVLAFPGVRPPRAPAGADGEDPDDAAERAALERGEDLLARPRLLYRLAAQAARFARETSGTEPEPRERKLLHRFAGRMALLRGGLVPDLYELVVAARGAVDDAFARDLLRLAGHWPHAAPEEGGVRLTPRDLGAPSRLVRLRPRLDRLAARPGLAARLHDALEDLRRGGGRGICSHRPEDVVVEALGAELRERGAVRASRAGERSVPFETGLGDGIDVRETLRRMPVDGRIWIRETLPVRGKVGAVVIVFDEDDDPRGERYPWCEVWHGEHEDESDMAYYATDPLPGMVAPGIHRAEYGGFLLVWPPWRLGDVWHDPAYRPIARNKPERLILGALDYSVEPLVVVVSPRPPRAALKGIARRLGRKIVHFPLGAVSREKLRRVRTFHVLAGKSLRPVAEELLDPP